MVPYFLLNMCESGNTDASLHLCICGVIFLRTYFAHANGSLVVISSENEKPIQHESASTK